MILGIPLAVWLGMLTIISLFITAGFGITMYKFNKDVFKYHKFFAFLTVLLALIHARLAFLQWFYGLQI